MLVLGITGRARSGKGTIAEAIQEACIDRFDCKTFEISDYVLAELVCIGKIKDKPRADLTSEELDLMVQHGVEKRKRNQYYWLEELLGDVNRQRPQVALIPNIRFLNEADFVHSIGEPGVIIRTKTYIFDGVEYISRDRDPNSIMEIEQEKIEADYFITVKRGNPKLTKDIAKVLFEHIINEKKI